MNKYIIKCVYRSASDDTVREFSLEKDGAVFIKTQSKKMLFPSNVEKKAVAKEYVYNFDVFFSGCDMPGWADLPDGGTADEAGSDSVTVTFDDGTEFSVSESKRLPEGEKTLFDDLRRYFFAYGSGDVKPYTRSYDSFDGGGPEYSAKIDVKGIFTWFSRRIYYNPDHERMCGSGYNVVYTLYPLRKGSASAVITGESPICPPMAERILADVDDGLNMTCRTERVPDEELRRNL